jgi:hypothetical protein
MPGRIKHNVTPFGVTGDKLDIIGQQELKLLIGDRQYYHQFCVCNLATEADAILGLDFLEAKGAKIDLENQEFCLLRETKPSFRNSETENNTARGTANRSALTVFLPSGKPDKQPYHSVRKGSDKRAPGRHDNLLRPAEPVKEAESWLVKTTETIKLVPRAKQIVIGRVELPKRRPREDALSRNIQAVSTIHIPPKQQVRQEQEKGQLL